MQKLETVLGVVILLLIANGCTNEGLLEEPKPNTVNVTVTYEEAEKINLDYFHTECYKEKAVELKEFVGEKIDWDCVAEKKEECILGCDNKQTICFKKEERCWEDDLCNPNFDCPTFYNNCLYQCNLEFRNNNYHQIDFDILVV